MQRLIAALTLLALHGLLALTAFADTTLLDVNHQLAGEAGVSGLQLVFGRELSLVSELDHDAQSLVFALQSQNRSDGDWQFAEMSFEEADLAVRVVRLEGSDRKGYTLRIQFSGPVEATVMPQTAGRKLDIKYLVKNRRARTAKSKAGTTNAHYVVNLESRAETVPTLEDVPPRYARDYRIYVLEYEEDGARWQRLRLGFFPTERAAENARNELEDRFPGAWVVKVDDDERRFGEQFALNVRADANLAVAETETPVPAEAPVVKIKAVTPSNINDMPETVASEPSRVGQERQSRPEDDPLEEDFKAARNALLGGDFNRGIALYTRLSQNGNPTVAARALELLGVAREQNGQLAHAKKVYEDFLKRYPENDAAERVNQRLLGITTMDRSPRKRRTELADNRDVNWRTYGYLSQFYRNQSIDISGQGRRTAIDAIFSDLGGGVRRIDADSSHELRVNLSHLQDFTGDRSGEAFRISRAYWDAELTNRRTSFRVGRQSGHDSGVLGRFDGVTADYGLLDWLRLGAVGGYLVDSGYDGFSSNRPFWGVNAEIDTGLGNLVVEPFFIQQDFDGILDRRAVGLQSRWYSDSASVFSLVDYDLYHKALNNLSFIGNYRPTKSLNFNGSVEIRRSPYLTTRNALIGQPYDELSELEQALIDLELADIASDRTAKTRTFRFGVDRALGKTWRLSLDFSGSNYASTESSANVLGLESTNYFYVTSQLRATDVFGAGSYSAVQMRYVDSDNSSTTSVYLNNRFNLGKNWWLYPRVRVDYRQYAANDDTQWGLLPSVRLDYKRRRGFRVELEAGYEWTQRERLLEDLTIQGFYVQVGYRWILQ